ncbi:MAG: hypothetical protein KKD86_11830, partial [Bacteroidetes bacterium]|nr:hypothetical protein [Bacteroidota bacterium]
MKRDIFLLLMSMIILISSFSFGQSVIINEIYNSSSTDEWVELLVLQDATDLRAWSIGDYSSSGSAQPSLTLSSHLLWSDLKKGTVIVIAKAENTFAEDTDVSDYKLIIKSNNGAYLSGTPFSIAGFSEAVQIMNSSKTHVHGVSWGSANANSLPQPKIHFTVSATSGNSIFFNEDELAKISVTSNWTVNGTPSLGVGNTANNLSWINSMRARSEGSGTISISPATAMGDSLIDIEFRYMRDSEFSVNSLKIIFNQEFEWSHNTSDISLTNFAANTVITSDTISFSSVVFSADTAIISFSNVFTPSFTGDYKFAVLSGSDNSLGTVSPLQVITIHGSPLPIADVKMNDENGAALKMGEFVTVRGIITV